MLTVSQTTLIACLLNISLIFLLIPIVCIPLKSGIYRLKKAPRGRTGLSNVMFFSVFLLFSVWCLRYAVGFYGIICEGGELTVWEEIFNSFVHAFQTFSMDEDYTEYIKDGKRMVEAIFGADSRWIGIYGGYASVLNFISPVAGGAIIFEVIANIFPRIRLFFSVHSLYREKYYFSKLNPASLALAKSIYQNHSKISKKPKPVVIFTDVHIDDETERDYELITEAKRIGAICLRDDLWNVSKVSGCSYYLIDDDEFSNLQALSRLAGRSNVRFLRRARIYLFVKSDAYVKIEQQVRRRLGISDGAEEVDGKIARFFNGKNAPLIVPVNSYRNLICNLFTDVPLYEPLLAKESDKEKLALTVVGNGVIGMEALLGAYWMGQMLSLEGEKKRNIALDIRVISKETEEEFWSKLNYINPEIKRTCDANDKILNARIKSERISYCNIRYSQLDVKDDGFWTECDPSIIKSDYIVVAIGSDADNIDVAEKLRCHIGKAHLESDVYSPTVIAYAVFDPSIAHLLNDGHKYKNYSPDKADIYMHAFGGLDRVFGYDNVFMSKSSLTAAMIGDAYEEAKRGKEYIKENEKRAKNESENYNYWANLGRALHIKYKVFSLGLIDTSLFDGGDAKAHIKNVASLCARYKTVCSVVNSEALGKEDILLRERLEKNKSYLAWLEHRRWCAFTRTMGYQQCKAPDRNSLLHANHKNMSLKLHSCLVEAYVDFDAPETYRYIQADFCKDGSVNASTVFKSAPCDALDAVSQRWYELSGKSSYDFKLYDFYRYEFEDCVILSDTDSLPPRVASALQKIALSPKKREAIKGDLGEYTIVALNRAKKLFYNLGYVESSGEGDADSFSFGGMSFKESNK